MYVEGKGKSMYIQRRIHMHGIFKMFLFRFLKRAMTSNSALTGVKSSPLKFWFNIYDSLIISSHPIFVPGKCPLVIHHSIQSVSIPKTGKEKTISMRNKRIGLVYMISERSLSPRI